MSANYRNQWANISNPYSTFGVSADFTTTKNANVGINIINQSAGSGGYNYLNASASFAFTGVRFGQEGNQRLVLALQAGVLNRRFDPSKFQFGDQWNPLTGYDPSNPTSDFLTRNSSTVFDAAAGVLYFDGDPNKVANIFGGFSMNHLTRPKDPFSSGNKLRMPFRYTVHGGMRIALSENVNITPNALYMRQGQAEEKMVGAYAQFIVSASTDFLAGGYYRYNDAIVPFAGFHYQSMIFGFSYDTNASRLNGLARSSSNSFEVSISFIGRKAKLFPDEYFFCPRL